MSTPPQLPQVPAPVSLLPWTYKDDAYAVIDANGRPVSFVENHVFIMHLAAHHVPLGQSLGRALTALEAAYITLENLTGKPRTDKHRAWQAQELAALHAAGFAISPPDLIADRLGESQLVWG